MRMNFFKFRQLKKEIVPILKNGGIGILPTDTIYGIVCSALNSNSVEKIYQLRKRNPKKPLIILISSEKNLEEFKIFPNIKIKKELKKVWPGKTSVIMDCFDDTFDYLTRGSNSLAFRVPRERWLRRFLDLTGPLVAPSANFEGESAAKNIWQAQNFFADKVDFYVDFGDMKSEPSTIIKIEKDGSINVLRAGAVKI